MKKSKVVLITGASSGFGLEFGHLFAAAGYDLVLTAKPPAKLAALSKQLSNTYGVKVWHHCFDLALPGASQKLYQWVKKEALPVSILVNNAGLGLYGRYASHKLEQERELINVNVNALSELCHLFIPGMIKQGGGKILNVASIAGFQAGPFYATYFASKGYVMLFSEALYYEYASDNITVTALCPGVSPTNFFKTAGMRQDSRLLQAYFMSPKQVATAGYKGLMNNKRLVIPGYRNKFVSLGYRVFPRAVIARIARRLISSAAQ
jgi:short-subunit dehydrogenase